MYRVDTSLAMISLAIGMVAALVLALVGVASSATGDDIEFKITNIWGSNYPILLFGQSATLGQVVTADLDSSPVSEPLPTYVPRGRNQDKTVISRFKISDTKVKIVADIASGTGAGPGSEGYIKITNPEWKVTQILSPDIGLGEHNWVINTGYSGNGVNNVPVNVDKENGIISWFGRADCYCGDYENGVTMTFIVEKKTTAPVFGVIIDSPKNNENINWSPEGYSVRGSFTDTISGLKTYVLIHPPTTTKWWVQRTPTIIGSNWETVVYLGTEDTGANENYEVYAIVTNKTLNEGIELGALPDYLAMASVTVFRPAKGALSTTPAPTVPVPNTSTESSNSFLYTAIGGISILLVAIMVLKRRSSSQEKEHPKPVPEHKEASSGASGIDIKTAFGYKGATIVFKIKMENNSSDPISDIKVYPYVPDVFLLKEKEKSIALIEPKSSQTVTFEIRPTGECGDCNVSGRVNYYDMASRKRHDIELEPKSLSIVCPMLHGKEISEADWHEAVSNLVKTEESTKEIEMPAESLFTMTSRIIKDMHMYMQKPEITQGQQLFNGVTRFYGEGVKGLRYAAQVEVVGGTKKSKLILKAWAEKEDALTGFYHGILDEIEKRINLKGYIDEPIIQNFIAGHYITGQVGKIIDVGDKSILIGTRMKSAMVQSSIIDADARKCPKCGREVDANEKFCMDCGARL